MFHAYRSIYCTIYEYYMEKSTLHITFINIQYVQHLKKHVKKKGNLQNLTTIAQIHSYFLFICVL